MVSHWAWFMGFATAHSRFGASMAIAWQSPWPVFWSETLESMSNSPVMSRRLSNHCISNKRLPSGKLT